MQKGLIGQLMDARHQVPPPPAEPEKLIAFAFQSLGGPRQDELLAILAKRKWDIANALEDKVLARRAIPADISELDRDARYVARAKAEYAALKDTAKLILNLTECEVRGGRLGEVLDEYGLNQIYGNHFRNSHAPLARAMVEAALAMRAFANHPDWPEGDRRCNEAIKLFRNVPEDTSRATTRYERSGFAWNWLSDDEKRETQLLFSRILDLAGLIAAERGNPDEASHLHEEARQIQQEVGGEEERASGLFWVAEMARAFNPPERPGLMRIGGRAFPAQNHQRIIMDLESHPSEQQQVDAGQPKDARGFYSELLQLREQVGEKQVIANALENLGHLERIRDPEKAREYYLEAFDLYKKLGQGPCAVRIRAYLAMTNARLGQVESALAGLKAAVTGYKKHKLNMADCYEAASHIAHATGQTQFIGTLFNAAQGTNPWLPQTYPKAKMEMEGLYQLGYEAFDLPRMRGEGITHTGESKKVGQGVSALRDLVEFIKPYEETHRAWGQWTSGSDYSARSKVAQLFKEWKDQGDPGARLQLYAIDLNEDTKLPGHLMASVKAIDLSRNNGDACYKWLPDPPPESLEAVYVSVKLAKQPHLFPAAYRDLIRADPWDKWIWDSPDSEKTWKVRNHVAGLAKAWEENGNPDAPLDLRGIRQEGALRRHIGLPADLLPRLKRIDISGSEADGIYLLPEQPPELLEAVLVSPDYEEAYPRIPEAYRDLIAAKLPNSWDEWIRSGSGIRKDSDPNTSRTRKQLVSRVEAWGEQGNAEAPLDLRNIPAYKDIRLPVNLLPSIKRIDISGSETDGKHFLPVRPPENLEAVYVSPSFLDATYLHPEPYRHLFALKPEQ